MPEIAANADNYVSSYPCRDAHERSSRDVGSLADGRHYILLNMLLILKEEKASLISMLVQ